MDKSVDELYKEVQNLGLVNAIKDYISENDGYEFSNYEIPDEVYKETMKNWIVEIYLNKIKYGTRIKIIGKSVYLQVQPNSPEMLNFLNGKIK